MLSKNIANTITLAKMIKVSSFISFIKRYILIMSNTNLDIAKKQKLTSIKKY